ncbi:Ankyrin repeat domain containing protein [Balamuthia mandrillaris]
MEKVWNLLVSATVRGNSLWTTRGNAVGESVEPVREGQLKVLQWARANGCPWNEETSEWAAKEGRLEVLQWAIANGCPWDKQTCKKSATSRKQMLKWLEEMPQDSSRC